MIKNSKFLGLIATVLLGIVPFAISGTSVYAAENDQVTVDSEITQNKVYISNPQDQVDLAEQTGESSTLEKIMDGDLDVDSSGNLFVTQKWIN